MEQFWFHFCWLYFSFVLIFFLGITSTFKDSYHVHVPLLRFYTFFITYTLFWHGIGQVLKIHIMYSCLPFDLSAEIIFCLSIHEDINLRALIFDTIWKSLGVFCYVFFNIPVYLLPHDFPRTRVFWFLIECNMPWVSRNNFLIMLFAAQPPLIFRVWRIYI